MSDYFVDHGGEATELGQCPFDVGTAEWKMWQEQYIFGRECRLNPYTQSAADARVAAVTGGKLIHGPGLLAPNALSWGSCRAAKEFTGLKSMIAAGSIANPDDDTFWTSTAPDDAKPIDRQALLEAYGALIVNDRKRHAKLTDLNGT